MADALEQLNNLNAKAKSISVRVKFACGRSPEGKQISLFTCVLNTESGHYANAEAKFFGDASTRKQLLDKAVAA